MPEEPEFPEIESLNLADLNVSGLDPRMELSTIIPQLIVCVQLCSYNCTCHGVDGCNVFCDRLTGCNCDALD
jgi:hypothetical protein